MHIQNACTNLCSLISDLYCICKGMNILSKQNALSVILSPSIEQQFNNARVVVLTGSTVLD